MWALPQEFSEEMVARYLLDVVGTRRVVGVERPNAPARLGEVPG